MRQVRSNLYQCPIVFGTGLEYNEGKTEDNGKGLGVWI